MKADVDLLSFAGSTESPERTKSLEAFLRLLWPEKRQDGAKS